MALDPHPPPHGVTVRLEAKAGKVRAMSIKGRCPHGFVLELAAKACFVCGKLGSMRSNDGRIHNPVKRAMGGLMVRCNRCGRRIDRSKSERMSFAPRCFCYVCRGGCKESANWGPDRRTG